MRHFLIAAGIAALATPAAAELTQRDPAGFVTEHRVRIAAPPARVWPVLVQPQLWWNPSHTYSGDAARLSLDAVPGGCWCETLASGGRLEHMRVLYVDPARLLRLSGALGPLQPGAVAGTMTVELVVAEGGTDLVLRYVVGGYLPGGLDALASPVDRVIAEQVTRLKRAVETPAG